MSEWVEETKGVFKYNKAPAPGKRNISSNELLAYCISLGADLRELYQRFDDKDSINYLVEIIDNHNFVFKDVKL